MKNVMIVSMFIFSTTWFASGMEHAAAIEELVIGHNRTSYFSFLPTDVNYLILGMNSLHRACKGDQLEKVKTDLKEGADMNAPDIFCRTPFYIACENGSVEIVRYLLPRIPGVMTDKKLSPLHIASINGCSEVINALLGGGADVNAVDSKGKTPLIYASENGSFSAVRTLLNAGARISTDERNALNLAAEKGYHEIVNLLLAKSEQQSNKFDSRSPLYGAANNNDIDSVRRLLIAGLCYDRPAALYAASSKGHVAVVDTLLSVGVDVRGSLRENPLDAAVIEGHINIVQLLLSSGANVSEYCLWAAVRNRDTIMMELLLSAGAKVSDSCIYAAIANRDLEALNRLLATNAKVSEAYLLSAVRSKDLPMIRMLSAAGAIVRDLDLFGAAQKGNVDVLKLLLSLPAEPQIMERRNVALNRRPPFGGMPFSSSYRPCWLEIALTAASRSGDLELVEKLLEFGADANTPLALNAAVEKGHAKIVQLLLSSGAKVSYGCLLAAVRSKNVEIIRLVFTSGAKETHASSCLSNAIGCRNVEIVKLLLSSGAKVSGGLYLGSVVRNRDTVLLNLLLSAGALGTNGLNDAVLNNDVEIVQLLLRPNSTVPEECLKCAVGYGNVEMVQLLLGSGAKVSTNCLSDAIGNNDSVIVGLLLAKLSRSDRAEYIKLFFNEIVQAGTVEMVKLFLSAGAKISEETLEAAICNRDAEMIKLLMPYAPKGVTHYVLEQAVRERDMKVIHWLLAAGANVSGDCLGEAIQKRDHELVKLLLASGAKVSDDCLSDAVKDGDLETVKLLLSSGAKVSDDCLSCAVKNGDLETIKLLLTAGAKVTDDCLRCAIQKEHTEILKLFLLEEIRFEGEFSYWGSWQLAIEKGDAEIVKFLLKAGVPIQRADLYSAVRRGHLEVVETLLATGAKVNNFGFEAALYSACKNGYSEIVKLLLRAGAKVTDDCMIEASQKGYTEIVIALHEAQERIKIDEDLARSVAAVSISQTTTGRGLEVERSSKTSESNSSQEIAVVGGSFASAAYSFKPRVPESFSSRPSVNSGDTTVARPSDIETITETILKSAADSLSASTRTNSHGANADKTDARASLASREASNSSCDADVDLPSGSFFIDLGEDESLGDFAESGNVEGVKRLLLAGADLKETVYRGMTCLHVAAGKGHTEVVKVLLEEGADVNVLAAFDRETPLHCAAQGGCVEMIKLLLNRGANVNARDAFDESVLHYAARNGFFEVVKTLLNFGAEIHRQGNGPHYIVRLAVDILK